VAGGRSSIQRFRVILWLKGDGIYSGMEWYFGRMEIVYTAVLNVTLAGGKMYIQP